MICTIHQPTYLPWLGLFDKVARADVFVILDTAQYQKNNVLNRNKIKTSDGPLWLTIPVSTSGKSTQPITEAKCIPGWGKKHWKAIQYNYQKAPHFTENSEFFEKTYSKKWEKLVDLNTEIVKFLFSKFGVDTKILMASDLKAIGLSTERLVNICTEVGSDTYIAGAGGKKYMDESLFTNAGINVLHQHFKHPKYTQVYGEFLPYMSSIDMLFNCGEEYCKNWLKESIAQPLTD